MKIFVQLSYNYLISRKASKKLLKKKSITVNHWQALAFCSLISWYFKNIYIIIKRKENQACFDFDSYTAPQPSFSLLNHVVWSYESGEGTPLEGIPLEFKFEQIFWAKLKRKKKKRQRHKDLIALIFTFSPQTQTFWFVRHLLQGWQCLSNGRSTIWSRLKCLNNHWMSPQKAQTLSSED